MITGFVEKKILIGLFGILYGHLGTVSENGQEVWSFFHRDFTPIGAYSFLIFNLLCAPCFAAVGAIRREMGDLKWTGTAIEWSIGQGVNEKNDRNNMIKYWISLICRNYFLSSVYRKRQTL